MKPTIKNPYIQGIVSVFVVVFAILIINEFYPISKAITALSVPLAGALPAILQKMADAKIQKDNDVKDFILEKIQEEIEELNEKCCVVENKLSLAPVVQLKIKTLEDRMEKHEARLDKHSHLIDDNQNKLIALNAAKELSSLPEFLVRVERLEHEMKRLEAVLSKQLSDCQITNIKE